MKKTPERVNDDARSEAGKEPVEKEKPSDLVEIAKQSGEFSRNYGRWWGGLIHLAFANAASGRRPLLWSGVASLGTLVGGLLWKYGVPLIAG